MQLVPIAIAGADYVSVIKEIIFTNYSQNPHFLYVPIINDCDCYEYDEYFFVNISASADCVNLPVEYVAITIEDDESELWDINVRATVTLLTTTVPEVSLETMFTEVNESNTIVSICVELKTYLKRNVTLYLDVIGYTATGEN